MEPAFTRHWVRLRFFAFDDGSGVSSLPQGVRGFSSCHGLQGPLNGLLSIMQPYVRCGSPGVGAGDAAETEPSPCPQGVSALGECQGYTRQGDEGKRSGQRRWSVLAGHAGRSGQALGAEAVSGACGQEARRAGLLEKQLAGRSVPE